MSDSKEYQIRQAINGLRWNYPEGVTTFGPCQNQCGSGRSGRGCGPCAMCYEKELAELTTPELAKQFHQLTVATAHMVQDLVGLEDDNN